MPHVGPGATPMLCYALTGLPSLDEAAAPAATAGRRTPAVPGKLSTPSSKRRSAMTKTDAEKEAARDAARERARSKRMAAAGADGAREVAGWTPWRMADGSPPGPQARGIILRSPPPPPPCRHGATPPRRREPSWGPRGIILRSYTPPYRHGGTPPRRREQPRRRRCIGTQHHGRCSG